MAPCKIKAQFAGVFPGHGCCQDPLPACFYTHMHGHWVCQQHPAPMLYMLCCVAKCIFNMGCSLFIGFSVMFV